MKSCSPVLSVWVALSHQLFDRGQLAIALHYTEFQAIPPNNLNDATCVISP